MSNNRTALVVGGSAGIGLAAAERLARRGVQVAIAGRREGALEDARVRIIGSTSRASVVTIVGDASDDESAGRIVATAVDVFGRLDSCIHCAAGLFEPVHLLDMDRAAWTRTLATTLDSAVYTVTPAAREMVKTGGGRFVLVSSINAAVSEPVSAHYSAAKSGVSSLVKSMAIDLAASNIVANAVAPGWVDTARTHELIKAATPEMAFAAQPARPRRAARRARQRD